MLVVLQTFFYFRIITSFLQMCGMPWSTVPYVIMQLRQSDLDKPNYCHGKYKDSTLASRLLIWAFTDTDFVLSVIILSLFPWKYVVLRVEAKLVKLLLFVVTLSLITAFTAIKTFLYSLQRFNRPISRYRRHYGSKVNWSRKM